MGQQELAVTAFFSDETGLHQVGMVLPVDIRERDDYLLFAGVLVLVICLLVFFFNAKKQKNQAPHQEAGSNHH